MKKKAMIVAAEASSSLFAKRLLEEWKRRGWEVDAFGVGAQDLEPLGFRRLGKSEEMAVVGASEILEHFGKLRAVFDSLVAAAEAERPDVVILMDYPEFNLYLSRKLKKFNLNVVYYVSPQIWAWRQGRVKTIKRFCKKCYVIFPFEAPFYEKHGVPVEFVGHPILDEMNDDLFNEEARKLSRSQKGILPNEIVLGLMPGSRRIELRNHLQLQLAVARRLVQKHSNLKVVLLVAPTVSLEGLRDQLGDLKFPIQVIKDEPFRMIQLTDLVLVASGTATLQVALLHKPMVVMYKMTLFTYLFAKTFVRGVSRFSLPNLIMKKDVVPERWQGEANEDQLFHDLDALICEPNRRLDMKVELEKIQAYLGEKGAFRRVTDSIKKEFFGSEPQRMKEQNSELPT